MEGIEEEKSFAENLEIDEYPEEQQHKSAPRKGDKEKKVTKKKKNRINN